MSSNFVFKIEKLPLTHDIVVVDARRRENKLTQAAHHMNKSPKKIQKKGSSKLKEMFDLQLARNLSRISEEKQVEADLLQLWERKAEEMEVVRALVDDGENGNFNCI